MKPTGTLTWNIDTIASALVIDPKTVRAYFTDGRRMGFLLERRLAFMGRYKLAHSEGAPFDVVDHEKGKWEVRCITESGVNFSPSSMIGIGRSFDEIGFLKKISAVAGYILGDIQPFPVVAYWAVPSAAVRGWWDSKSLRSTSSVGRAKILQLISALPENSKSSTNI